MKKLTQKDADDIFKLVKKMEELHWDHINALDETIKLVFGKSYELAVVDGNVVGVGKVTPHRNKIIFHR